MLFTENNLSILPKNDGYVIGTFDPFVKLSKNPDKIKVKRVPPRTDLESLNYIPNEAMGINYAEVYGSIEDFIGDGHSRQLYPGAMEEETESTKSL